jgi:ankyrin repeat protein
MKRITPIILVLAIILIRSTLVFADDNSAPKSISEYFKDDKLVTVRQAFYNADRTQRVEYYCDDENMPGGANEGASNPANVHCAAVLFIKQSGKWIFGDRVELKYGSVNKFAGHRLEIKLLEYGDDDALCCPSKSSTQIFNTDSGKLIEDTPALIQAIQNDGDTNQIAKMLSGPVDVNAKNGDGLTALMAVAEADNGNNEIAQLLLKHGANVNDIRSDGETPLMLAVEQNKVELVRTFLDHNANIEVVRNDGKTPLIIATYYGFTAIAQMLVNKGANVNARTKDGENALVNATQQGQEDFVRLLLAKGADVNARVQNDATVLVIAVKGAHPNCKMARLLLDKGANANELVWGSTVLMEAAAYSGDTDCLQALFEKGANIDAKDKVGQTPLFYAAKYGPVSNVEWLLKNGADPNVISYGKTALDVARERGKKEVVEYLENYKSLSKQNTQGLMTK